MIREDLRQGQRIEAFAFDAWTGQEWQEIAAGTTVGWKKLLRFPALEATKVRVRILKSRGDVPPIVPPDAFGLYFDPFRPPQEGVKP
jgi:alpha-L-fucosidase